MEVNRPRDSQRQKVYDAEFLAFKVPQAYDEISEWDGHDEATWPMTLDQTRAFVNSVANSAFWSEHGGPDRVEVADGRSRRSGGAYPERDLITLPRWTRRRYYALHELAHLLAPRDAAWHGPEWVRCYVALIERFLDVKAATTLVGAMRLKGVRRHSEAELRAEARRRVAVG